eukprot:COSAG01_NODE_3457_length_6072_cov_14.110330_6_plen_108_part_00
MSADWLWLDEPAGRIQSLLRFLSRSNLSAAADLPCERRGSGSALHLVRHLLSQGVQRTDLLVTPPAPAPDDDRATASSIVRGKIERMPAEASPPHSHEGARCTGGRD